MQKKTKLLAAVAGPSMLMATGLFAQTNLTVTLDLSNGYRDPNSYGGEFTAVFSGNNSFSSYVLSHYNSNVRTTVGGQTGIETFCVEMNQNFSPGTPYSATVGPSIVNGNGSSPLTEGVAWLYMEFVTGGLATAGNTYSLSSADYNYSTGSGRELCADELQDAIWYLQGELGSSGNSQTRDSLYSFSASTDPYVQLVEDRFGSLGGAEESDTAPGESNFGVEVLNLTSQVDGCTAYNQDQLIYCPVPEPATLAAGAMLLVPLGLSGLRALRKKNSAQ
jgi:hypothetical protein